MVVHQYDISGLNSSITSQATHGDTDISTCQHWGIVNAITNKGNVRVAYELVMGREAALRRLEIIKTEYNEAAWLLRKK